MLPNSSINVGGFAIPIRGASSRGITEPQEHQPPLKVRNPAPPKTALRSKLRGIHYENQELDVNTFLWVSVFNP